MTGDCQAGGHPVGRPGVDKHLIAGIPLSFLWEAETRDLGFVAPGSAEEIVVALLVRTFFTTVVGICLLTPAYAQSYSFRVIVIPNGYEISGSNDTDRLRRCLVQYGGTVYDTQLGKTAPFSGSCPANLPPNSDDTKYCTEISEHWKEVRLTSGPRSTCQ